jgi:hypothetical protein
MGGQRVTSGRCIAAVVMQLASAEEGRRAGSGRRSSGGSFRHDRVVPQFVWWLFSFWARWPGVILERERRSRVGFRELGVGPRGVHGLVYKEDHGPAMLKK